MLNFLMKRSNPQKAPSISAPTSTDAPQESKKPYSPSSTSAPTLTDAPQQSKKPYSPPPMSEDAKSVIHVLHDAYKVFAAHDKKRGSVVSQMQIPYPVDRNLSSFRFYASKLLNNFHNQDTIRNQISIARFALADSNCECFVILRMLENDLFRIYFRGSQPLTTPETYDLGQFSCLKSIIQSKKEMIQSDEDVRALSMLVQWKPILQVIPDVVVAIPILQVNQNVCAIVALSFKKKLPSDFMSTKFAQLKDFLSAVVPYAMLLQSTHDYEEDCHRQDTILESLDIIERDIRDPERCAISIGSELAKLTDCRTHTVLRVDYTESILTRLIAVGKQKSAGVFGCMDSRCHEEDFFQFDNKSPVGWVASRRMPIKWNESTDCKDLGMTKKQFHSVLSCTSLKNILIIPVNDHSTEKSLVIELVDKDGGFTLRDMELCCGFSRAVTFVYTCSVMAAHRNKSYRRNSMLNQILLNIEPVKHVRVEQFLTSLRRTSQNLYTGKFLTFSFSVKNLSENEMSGSILHIFYDLNFVTQYKIRKTTLIRFLLTAQQGYRQLAYHNWQHACSVTHFAYLMIKNLKLVTDGYITQLEAFGIIVSALVHDIDHRGTNNRFQSCTNSELFQLYNTQESVMERHHLSIALSILRREECNLIENLSQEDYKEFLELMAWNILATDIARYIQSRDSNFKKLGDFRKDCKEDRLALLSLMMTAADVNDCIKSWDDNLLSVKQILSEFFEQGDLEKELGMTPMSMMDRNQAYIPEVEFKFLSGIVHPVYRELANKFPGLQSCAETISKFLEYWELSTVIFDANKHKSDQLAILSSKELTEDSLKGTARRVDKSLLRRFTEKHDEKLKRGTMHTAMDKIIPNKLRKTKKKLPSNTTVVDHPEEEFRQMFTENEADASADDSDTEQKRKCGCCKKKQKKPEPRLTENSVIESERCSLIDSNRQSVAEN